MPEADAEDIAKAGEEFLLALYGASAFQTLDDFRLNAFRKKNAKKSTNKVFQMASLPPTCAAARQHSFRTYCQVQQWLENDIDPAKWGWIPDVEKYVFLHHLGLALKCHNDITVKEMFWKVYQDFWVTVFVVPVSFQRKAHYLGRFQYRHDVIFAYFSVFKGNDYTKNVFSFNFELIHVHIFNSN